MTTFYTIVVIALIILAIMVAAMGKLACAICLAGLVWAICGRKGK